MLIGHSFVRRFARRATLQGQSTAEAVGVAGVCELHTFSTPTFASLLACPAALLVRMRTLRQLPDILVIDLGSNDLCPVDAAVSRVVAEAMDLLEWLHGHYLLPRHVVFMSVLQRTTAGCLRGVPARTFNHRARAFNARLAARVRQLHGVHMFAQSRLNLPRYICQDGCHLTDAGMGLYGRLIRMAILIYGRRC